MNKVAQIFLKTSAAFLLLFVVGIFLLIMVTEGTFESALPFERDVWLHATDENKMYFPRLRMADYLIDKELLSNKSREEVLSLLGEPELTNTPWSEDESFGLIYHLGPERGWISIDSEWLAIRFNSNGQIMDYKIVRD